jgi:hypothetical protein
MKSLARINGRCGEVNKTCRKLWIFYWRGKIVGANAKQ